MNYRTYVLINGPLVVLSFVANAFYSFCMVWPLHRERIKQPLRLLLSCLIFTTVTFLMSTFVMLLSGLPAESSKLAEMSHMVASCSLFTSLTSSVWLNFFYYTQIVPAQRAFFMWIKKNIKRIIYCIWLAETFYSFFDFTIKYLGSVPLRVGFSYNFTVDHDTVIPTPTWFEVLNVILAYTMKGHFFFSLCVMVMSSASTVIYLIRHMRRMVANGQPLSCPHFRGQVRVTVIGILQGVLFVFCATWSVYNTPAYIPPTGINRYTHLTVINAYMAGTTFNLGAGQAALRRRAADIWVRAAQCCKAPEAKQSEPGG